MKFHYDLNSQFRSRFGLSLLEDICVKVLQAQRPKIHINNILKLVSYVTENMPCLHYENNSQMLFRNVIAVYSVNHVKANSMGKMQSFIMLKQRVCVMATVH
jgi:hypothetical protein